MAELVPVDHDPFAAGPTLVPVDHDPFSTVEAPGPYEGFSAALTRGATMGLSDQMAALAHATRAIPSEAKRLVNSVLTHEDGTPLFDVSADDPRFGDLYREGLERERAKADAYQAEHPIASRLGYAVGLPASLGATASGAAVPAFSGPTPGLLQRSLKSAGVGAATGGVVGAGNSDLSDPLETAKNAGVGAAVGGTIGGAVPSLAYLLNPLTERVARGFDSFTRRLNDMSDVLGTPGSSNIVDRQAAKRLANVIASDERGGGPGLQQIQDELAASSKPLTVTDVGGENVRGLTGRLARQPGESRGIITRTLNERDAGAGPRLASDVDAMLSNGGSAFKTAQNLAQQRAAASAPAYEKAGIPSDPALYPTAPVVDSPAVTRLLEKSKAVQTAIRRAQELPDYADLPPNSIVLLDKAYKNIGGMANEAKLAGNGEASRDLNSLRVQLRDAITGGDPNHPYQLALDAYSGPSASIGAVKEGQAFLTKRPEQIAEEVGNLAAGDRDFYKLGAADAIRQRIARTSSGGDEAKRIVGNDYIKQQLRPLFNSDAEYEKFVKAATDEAKMFATRNSVLGNSQTAARLAEDMGGEGPSVLGPALQVAGGIATGEPIAGLIGVPRLARSLGERLSQPGPEVGTAMARMLMASDPAARAAFFNSLTALPAPRSVPGAVLPLASLAGRAYPALTSGRP